MVGLCPLFHLGTPGLPLDMATAPFPTAGEMLFPAACQAVDVTPREGHRGFDQQSRAQPVTRSGHAGAIAATRAPVSEAWGPQPIRAPWVLPVVAAQFVVAK